jgi:ubiquinone/menaquinone biosynthesis C-methylase UbiE
VLTNYDIKEMAPCVDSDLPYADASKEFCKAVMVMPETPFAEMLKALVCYDIFHKTEKILLSEEDPTPTYLQTLKDNTALIQTACFRNEAFTSHQIKTLKDIEEQTSLLYGSLFEKFDDRHYYDEAMKNIRERFKRNNFDFSFVHGKSLLDAGCGNGRYTIALKLLGYGKVVGLDMSHENISTAEKRLKVSGIKDVAFQNGSVLNIPYPDNSFDSVFSNGVLHHTEDMKNGVKELLRVLKSKGKGFLYVIEAPGGIFWDVIECLRVLMHNVPFEIAQQVFSLLGVAANRRFYILDHIMVPINTRSTSEQIEGLLKDAGARNIRRLTRGCDYDRIEKIYNKEPYHDVKYGVGENRYFFDKL